MRDKEWLKQQVVKNYPSQSEINNPDYVVITKVEIIDEFLSLIDQLDEPQKPVVPQFVANYIEKYKGIGFSLGTWFDFVNVADEFESKTEEWLYGDSQEEKLKREYLLIDAIRYGYEVEKEPQWVVVRNCMYINNLYFGEMNDDYRVGSIADKEQAMVFTDKAKAEAVALLVDGEVEEVTE